MSDSMRTQFKSRSRSIGQMLQKASTLNNRSENLIKKQQKIRPNHNRSIPRISVFENEFRLVERLFRILFSFTRQHLLLWRSFHSIIVILLKKWRVCVRFFSFVRKNALFYFHLSMNQDLYQRLIMLNDNSHLICKFVSLINWEDWF